MTQILIWVPGRGRCAPHWPRSAWFVPARAGRNPGSGHISIRTRRHEAHAGAGLGPCRVACRGRPTPAAPGRLCATTLMPGGGSRRFGAPAGRKSPRARAFFSVVCNSFYARGALHKRCCTQPVKSGQISRREERRGRDYPQAGFCGAGCDGRSGRGRPAAGETPGLADTNPDLGRARTQKTIWFRGEGRVRDRPSLSVKKLVSWLIFRLGEAPQAEKCPLRRTQIRIWVPGRGHLAPLPGAGARRTRAWRRGRASSAGDFGPVAHQVRGPSRHRARSAGIECAPARTGCDGREVRAGSRRTSPSAGCPAPRPARPAARAAPVKPSWNMSAARSSRLQLTGMRIGAARTAVSYSLTKHARKEPSGNAKEGHSAQDHPPRGP